MIENLESRRLLAFALNVNFQPAGSTVPSGYFADTGATYASRGNGFTYGWNASASSFTRDRNSARSPDQRYDTIVHTQLYGTRTWELAVPNGTYSVRIVAGDPNYTDSTIKFNAENVLVTSGSLSSSQHFIDGTKTVTVSDGRLTISNASGASNNKLCFVQISAVGSGSSGNTVSIAATDANASETGDTGAFKISRTGSTASPLMVNYSVTGSATNGTDYGSIANFVTIPAGSTFATVTIKPHSDNLVEGAENVILKLSAPSGYSLGQSNATVTIADANSPITSGAWPTSWTLGPSISKPRWESTGLSLDGKVYVFGGWMSASTTATQQYDVYDPATNKWTTLGYMPVPHTHADAAVDEANHVIYFAGGYFGNYPGIPSNVVYKYDALTNKFTQMVSLPQNHEGGALVLVNNTLHYIGGVGDVRSDDIDTHLVLDLNNQAAGWQSAPAMPDPRDHFAHAVIGNKIYCIGGEFGHDTLHLQQNFVDVYDTVAQTWTRVASVPQARSHDESSTWVTADNKIISAGGQTDNFGQSDLVFEYDPVADKWTTIGKLPEPLMGPVVQRIGNEIIVATGNAGKGPITTTWIGQLP